MNGKFGRQCGVRIFGFPISTVSQLLSAAALHIRVDELHVPYDHENTFMNVSHAGSSRFFSNKIEQGHNNVLHVK
jgi:heme-binding NEAT domain protein